MIILNIGHVGVKLMCPSDLGQKFVDIVGSMWLADATKSGDVLTEFHVTVNAPSAIAPVPSVAVPCVLHAEKKGRRVGLQDVWGMHPAAHYQSRGGDDLCITYERFDAITARDLLQVIRSRALFLNSRVGASVLHCAVVALSPGRGVMLVGGKGAGKTTTALGLCRNGAKFVASDKAILSSEGRVFGIPEAITLADGAPEIQLFDRALVGRLPSTGKAFVLPGYAQHIYAEEPAIVVNECWVLSRNNSSALPRARVRDLLMDGEIDGALEPTVNFSHAVHGDWLGVLPVLTAAHIRTSLAGCSFQEVKADGRNAAQLSDLAARRPGRW